MPLLVAVTVYVTVTLPVAGIHADRDVGLTATVALILGASLKNAYATKPEDWPVAFNRNESPGQLQTVQLVTKPPNGSACTVQGK